ncbi:MAG: hypothetical protein JO249_22030 [Acidobacteria bacterium]|nr:hypothetical protein [Acidobacteriota bacterium]
MGSKVSYPRYIDYGRVVFGFSPQTGTTSNVEGTFSESANASNIVVRHEIAKFILHFLSDPFAAFTIMTAQAWRTPLTVSESAITLPTTTADGPPPEQFTPADYHYLADPLPARWTSRPARGAVSQADPLTSTRVATS